MGRLNMQSISQEFCRKKKKTKKKNGREVDGRGGEVGEVERSIGFNNTDLLMKGYKHS